MPFAKRKPLSWQVLRSGVADVAILKDICMDHDIYVYYQTATKTVVHVKFDDFSDTYTALSLQQLLPTSAIGKTSFINK